MKAHLLIRDNQLFITTEVLPEAPAFDDSTLDITRIMSSNEYTNSLTSIKERLHWHDRM